MLNHQRPTSGKRMFRMLGCCAALSLIPGAALANEERDGQTQPGDTRSDFDNPATQPAETNSPGAATNEEQATSPQQSGQQANSTASFRNACGDDVSATNLSELGEDQIRSMQRQLQEMGYYTGPVDGLIGPQTRRALNNMAEAQFQLSQQMVQQGKIPPSLASTLNVANGSSDTSQRDSDMQRNDSASPQQPAQPTTPQQEWQDQNDMQQQSPEQEPYQGQSEREPTPMED